eukprot:scaffold28585_cov79-Cyclotella_meneghiniana.AAC.8
MRAATSKELSSMIIALQTAGFTNSKVQRLLSHLEGIPGPVHHAFPSRGLLDHLQRNPHSIPSSDQTKKLTLELTEYVSGSIERKNSLILDLRSCLSLDLFNAAKQAFGTCTIAASQRLILSFQYLCAIDYRKTFLAQQREGHRSGRYKETSWSERKNKEHDQLTAKRRRDSRDEMFQRQVTKRQKFQNDPSKRRLTTYAPDLSLLIAQEDSLFSSTAKGRDQIRVGVEGISLRQRMREVVVLANNVIVSNILDEERPSLEVLPCVDNAARSFFSFDDSVATALKQRVRSAIQFLPVSFNEDKTSTVVVLFIRISPDTRNDGLRQKNNIMMVVRQLQHEGFNLQ